MAVPLLSSNDLTSTVQFLRVESSAVPEPVNSEALSVTEAVLWSLVKTMFLRPEEPLTAFGLSETVPEISTLISGFSSLLSDFFTTFV